MVRSLHVVFKDWPSKEKGSWTAAVLVLLLVLTTVSGVFGDEPSWYVGAFHFRWRTTDGKHGHLADCQTAQCDAMDRARGNLDNAFGLRLGLERAVHHLGPVRLLAGAEGQVLLTEYNLSQHDLAIGELLGFLGGSVDLGPVRLGAKAGLGGVLGSDGGGGVGKFLEGAIEAPAGAPVALRAGFRRSWHAGPSTDELSLSILLRPREGEGRWNVGWSAGVSIPGVVIGQDRSLSNAVLWQLSVMHVLGSSPYRLGIAAGAAGHESLVRTDYGEVSGNERGKEIFDVTLLADRNVWRTGKLRWRAGLGLRAARWEDETSLLLDQEGGPLEAGTEIAGLASLSARLEIANGIGLVGRIEQSYWPSLELGELRALVGVETGPAEAPPRRARPPRAEPTGRRPTFFKRLALDLRDLAAVPWHMTPDRWRALGWGTAGVGGSFLLDQEIRDLVQRNRTETGDRWVDALRPLGNQGALGVIGLIWLSGKATGDTELLAIGEDAFEATLFTSLLIVPTLKATTGRARPDAGLGQTHFDPFSGSDAFPSGEAAQAFVIASVVAAHARARWVKILGWGLAGTLAYGRIYLDRHWTSDVVAGALIGTGVGSWVAARRRPQASPNGRRTSITVLPAPGGIEIRGHISW